MLPEDEGRYQYGERDDDDQDGGDRASEEYGRAALGHDERLAQGFLEHGPKDQSQHEWGCRIAIFVHRTPTMPHRTMIISSTVLLFRIGADQTDHQDEG